MSFNHEMALGLDSSRNEPIAIVGTGCRFPGNADTPSRLWDLLKEPRDVLSKIPSERFSAEGFFNSNSNYHGNSNVRHSYFLNEDVRVFDPQFFGVSPVEAHAMDPQQRILLEVVYEALEAGGHPIYRLRNSDTAVYVGAMCSDYETMLLRDTDAMPTYQATGTARSILSNRVSYFFDWKGPSMTIDTACSSSLVALHQAVQVLRSGDSQVAIAAGTNLILGADNYIGESKLSMLSPTGRSRMWDVDADGYARGEGVAAVVMKRLSTAIKDGDHIECIVRETGINQDGRTKGITMPSAISQARLIRQVYNKAGLNPEEVSDRCQFFECHGTGTPAGDPVEAEAISSAFFGPGRPSDPSESPLYVGSIKTVVGHTEGTAGLAAVVKVSLAVQHGTIPPNMLFNTLNPAVEPFYKGLEIPVAPVPWPTIAAGQPRRASVNSFGFGGSNAHVIIESYDGKQQEPAEDTHSDEHVGAPFVFSANSARSLKALLSSYLKHLRENTSTSLKDLAWTLSSRRSTLPVRISITAGSRETLLQKLEAVISGPDTFRVIHEVPSDSRDRRNILGVFTGQGAQWSAMGRELIVHSDFARERLAWLDAQLQDLPAQHRPAWSMVDKLLSGDEIKEATLAQPICTAVQILLVDLLRATKVRLDSVVGHSSGEIAAAYAAGYISAQDACRIAYYRGMHARQASGPGGEPGRMMAVVTSNEDAQDLCDLPHFRGRICVAASNAPSSVTISGDEDAVLEAQVVFEDEGKAARMLVVDKAYHSHHMLKCATPYEESMRWFRPCFNSKREVTSRWFSSVYNEEVACIPDKMNAGYWNANMVSAVRFCDAIKTAYAASGPFDAVVEIGPHPALKRPVLETIQSLGSSDAINYTGLLHRGHHDLDAISEALGSLWTSLGSAGVLFQPYQDMVFGHSDPRLLTDLPTYAWDISHEYWHESRAHRCFRTRKDPTHPLLGNLLPDGTAGRQYRWRNLLSVKEVPWLDGHKLQGQTVFPAAGYCCMAFEAVKVLLGQRTARALALEDTTVHSALVFQDDETATETLFSLDVREETESHILAEFALFAMPGADHEHLTLKASGTLRVALGSHCPDALPCRAGPSDIMTSVNTETFYSSLSEIGYGYSGPFRALDNLSRKAGCASGTLSNSPGADADHFLIHPATLDSAIQAVILAYCYPRDGRLFAIHVPTSIRSIRINPGLCVEHLADGPNELVFDSAQSSGGASALFGDVDLFSADGKCVVQLEGVRCILFAQATAADDTRVFSSTVWKPAEPNCASVCWDGRATDDEYQLAKDLERVCLYYLNLWESQVPKEHPARSSGPYKGLFRFSAHTRTEVQDGAHIYAEREWMNDTADIIDPIRKKHAESLDMRMVDAVGRNIPGVVKGETTILEHLMKDDLLGQYYCDGLGHPSYTTYLARTLAQISHRYPAINVLEIGAGTGHATKRIFGEIGDSFGSYTYTDLSSGFFERAQEAFSEHTDKMSFQVLDIEKDVTAQGYKPHSFDVVVASLVLHATSSLERTLRNVRRLLKPGGYLVMLEQTNNEPMRYSFMFGSLPGWWVGEPDGRLLSPCVGPVKWDALLRQTGFSGADSITEDLDRLPYPASVMVAQAVSDRVNLLREPLAELSTGLDQERIGDELFIIGGATLKTSRLAQGARRLLANKYASIRCYDSFAEMARQEVTPTTSVLNLSDLDVPVFENLTESSFAGMKAAFQSAKVIVWFTANCRTSSPYANMSVGFGRSMLLEIPGLQVQFMDMENGDPDVELVVKALLRFTLATDWDSKGSLGDDVLWSVESELAFTAEGLMIPRLKPNSTQNNRYNSTRRRMTETTSLSEHEVCLVGDNSEADSGHVQLERGLPLSQMRATVSTRDSSLRLIKVHCSSLAPVLVGHLPAVHAQGSHGSALYVLLGTDDASELPVAAFSETRTSSALVPALHCVELSEDQKERLGNAAHTLAAVCDNLISLRLLSALSPGQTLLVHEPPSRLATTLSRRAADSGVLVRYTTRLGGRRTEQVPGSESPDAFDHAWISLPPRASRRQVAQSLPPASNIAAFIDLAVDAEGHELGEIIAECLPPHCVGALPGLVVSDLARLLPKDGNLDLRGFLQDAIKGAAKDAHATGARDGLSIVTQIPVGDCTKWTNDMAFSSVLDWTTGRESLELATLIKPADSRPLFRLDRTYWLVGLTGDLGLSLAEWMVGRGAKHIVLSSRNPHVDRKWLAKMQHMGGSVHIWSNDVADIQDLRRCYEGISRTLPPLAGVAQGAMVLQDMAIRDMNLENMSKVLRPKVQGSVNLDKILGSQDLDFFVYLSSMASVVGNMGQSNYTAANMFMATLAAQRRARGLCASTINIGVIIGLGYVTREADQASQDNMYTSGYMFMSEQTFHQIFAEAVIAGQSRSRASPEISTGLRHVSSTDERQPIWANNPRFSHYISRVAAGGSRDNDSGRGVPLSTQLKEATSEERVFQIVLDAFLAKLQILLKSDPREDRTEASMLALRTENLGIDSLVAVEIRSWFLKALQVNMPVLKILGGASIGDLLAHALPQLPKHLTPMLNLEGQALHQTAHDLKLQDLSSPSDEQRPLASGAATASQQSSTDLDALSDGTDTGSSLPSDEEGGQLLEAPKLERSGPLSYSQSMFWFVNVFIDDPSTLNHTGSFRIRGRIHTADLQRAIILVGMQHESLRTCFNADEEGQPRQTIMSSTTLHLEVRRITAVEEVTQRFEELSNHEYDLSRGQNLRVLLLTMTPDEHYLLVGCHHINMDGYSHQVFMRDLEKAYNGKQLDNCLQYLDYTIRQKEEAVNGMWQKELKYWRDTLQGLPPVMPILPLPDAAKQRSAMTSYGFHRFRIDIDEHSSDTTNRQSRRLQTTPFQFYLAAFRCLLVRLGTVDDFCIGFGDANRTRHETMNSMGPYINLLPLRCASPSDKTSFAELLSDTRKCVLECLSNSRVPFGAILDDLQLSRSQYYSPVFQTFFDYRESTNEMNAFAGMDMEMLKFETGRTGYDLNIDIIKHPSGGKIEVMVQNCLYSQSDGELLARSYKRLIEAFSADPDQSLYEPSMFEDRQIEDGLALGRGIYCPSEWPETLVHRVVEIAERSGDKIAVKDGTGAKITYSELLGRVESIAESLLASGLKGGSIVGIFHERTLDWICSMLAVMHAGAAYLPLDTSMPIERLAVIVQDCRPDFILTDPINAKRTRALGARDARIVDISAVPPSTSSPPRIKARQDAAGVVFYTSGSTGVPKGISISHRSLRNEVEFSALTYSINVERVLQQSALSFDMSLTQIFGALAFGGYLYLCPSSVYADPLSLAALIRSEDITMTGGTPSEYLSWIGFGATELRSSSWKIAISGGESVNTSLLRAFKSLDKNSLCLYNAYGPTEATCSSSRKLVNYEDDIHQSVVPAGQAAPNARIYIVDSYLRALPAGFRGEILIGGAGVAAGYLSNSDETATRFLPDTFATKADIARGWVSMHRTGDMGRLMKDGNLLVEGRVDGDTQVKLRGIRTDLREIEHAILQAADGALVDVIVGLVHESSDIIAHAVPAPGVSLTSEMLAQVVTLLPLPRHMKPSVIIPVHDLPRGTTGKIDRKAVSRLPLPSSSQSHLPSIGSLNKDEEQMRNIWSETIPPEIFDRHLMASDTDFFHVGGNSLLLVELQRRIKTHFRVHLELVLLFDASTLGRMSALVKEKTNATELALDWDVETELPTWSAPQQPRVAARAAGSCPGVVVLTGATGYLGRELLDKLVADQNVQTIHCLAVRTPERLANLSDKIKIHMGDLGAPRLGLPEQAAACIFAEADVVIHNGANVSHLKHYRSLRAENVASTGELVRLSSAGGQRPPIHYISTAGVAGYTGLEEFGEVSVATFSPPTDGAEGYTASKWASERLLEKASSRLGLNVVIHRPSNIAREDLPDLDLFQNLLKYSLITRSVPSSPKLSGYLNIVGVDECASGILAAALAPAEFSDASDSLGEAGHTVRYLHSIGSVNLRLDDLKDYVTAKGTATPHSGIAILSLGEWAQVAEAAGMHPTLAAYFRHVEERGITRYPLLIREG